MKTGLATVPLDYGRCPRWLFERMVKLSRGITSALVEEFGPDEFVRRISDPIWFQSLGCVIGFDYNSSGLTTITLGALKEGLFEVQDELGLYVCGGKRTSRETPKEIEAYGISRGFDFAPQLIYASKMAAKVDSALIQDGFSLYQHNLVFTKSGQWAVVQQGMNVGMQKARRYHWWSASDFIEEPHSGIASDVRLKPLNLVAKKSRENREVSVGLVLKEPKKFLRDLNLIQTKRSGNLIEMELQDKEFYWHPVIKEKFDLKRLGKIIFAARSESPENFEQFLSLKGVGAKTIRALSLVAEIIYGAEPSFEDPARYSFTVGGKDGTPFPVEEETYDQLLDVMEKGILKSRVSLREKNEAQRRLAKTFQ